MNTIAELGVGVGAAQATRNTVKVKPSRRTASGNLASFRLFRGLSAREQRAVAATRAFSSLNLSDTSTEPSSAPRRFGLPCGKSHLRIATFGKCLKLRRCQPVDGSIRGPATGLQPRRPSAERRDGLSIHDDSALDQTVPFG